MNTLPLEVIEYIAKLDNKTWYRLVQVYKFLSEKNNVEDIKRKFLLFSSIHTEYKTLPNYKWKRKFHHPNKDKQSYTLVYYLPNGDLHTFENPCETLHLDNIFLNIWFKDNKIHRDNDEPAVVSVNPENTCVYLYSFPVFTHLYNQLGELFYIRDYTKMWFKNNNLYRDNDLPVIIKYKDETYKEWRKNNILHREKGPAVICGDVQMFYKDGLLMVL